MGATRPLSTDPLRNFKFTVNIPLQQNGVTSQIATVGFMQAQGIGIQVEPLTYREGGDNTTTRKMPGQADFNPITLTHGLFPSNWQAWYWIQTIFSVVQGGVGGQGAATPPYVATSGQPDFRTTIYINVLEHPSTYSANGFAPPGNPGTTNPNALTLISFKLFSAWIMGLAYSDLDAGGNAVAIEQMQIAYEGLDVHWGPGFGGYVTNPVGW